MARKRLDEVKHLAEADLKRLEELSCRLKASKTDGPKFTVEERRDLRKLKALRAAAQAAEVLGKMADEERKAEDRAKYRLGGLVMKAGLASWPEKELFGGLLTILQFRETNKARFIARAEEFEKANTPQTVRLRVWFPDDPGPNVRTALHRRKFVYSDARKAWEGIGVLTEIQAKAALGDGTVQVIEEEAITS